ncbi:50S ribosomal protein L25/general stress protein Ctc [Chlamydiifrater volucris]|uniref:50S ribosomal protein L25/general stress protein Ctc n=1 Tax=Chlamydiifrater volucris TaxID=2681470 RepID=UPI001BD06AA4|nr:50S ribosomal protein L25/general stress protein Ctc [Chlamydiifrater volucris]
MKLVVTSRETGKKSFLKMIRQQGGIPAVVYSKGETVANVVVDGHVFNKFLNGLETGALSSTVFSIEFGGKTFSAIIKDIQYKITTYEVIHLDFEMLHNDSPVQLNIPIRFSNIMECIGVKLGGTLRQIIYSLKVTCLPKDIVPFLELDVRDLGMSQTRKLSDIALPKGVKPITPLREVVATVSRR